MGESVYQKTGKWQKRENDAVSPISNAPRSLAKYPGN